MSGGIMCCPHREGIDYEGEDAHLLIAHFGAGRPSYGQPNPIEELLVQQRGVCVQLTIGAALVAVSEIGG